MAKRSSIFLGVVVGFFVLAKGGYAAEAVYQCDGLTRHGKGRKLYENHKNYNVPTPKQTAEEQDADLFRAEEGAKTATKDVAFELADGSVFQLFKYPKPHALGDHMVAAFRHPGKKQALFQVYPFGIPYFTLNYNYQDKEVAGADAEGDVMEHRIDCHLQTFDRASLHGETTPAVEIADDTRWSCLLDAGNEDEDYSGYTSWYANPLEIDWSPSALGRGSLTTFEKKPLVNLAFERRFKTEYQAHIVEMVQGGQIYSRHPDFLVDLRTGKPNGKRLQTVYLRMMTSLWAAMDGTKRRLATSFQCDRLPAGAPMKKDADPKKPLDPTDPRNSDFFALN